MTARPTTLADLARLSLEAVTAAPAPQTPPEVTPAWHGLTLADLRTATGEDWPEVRDRPAALDALAGLLHTQAQRDRGEVPSHYTQAAECATCGPVWLWEGAPARLIACPWCLTRPKGAPTPRLLEVTP